MGPSRLNLMVDGNFFIQKFRYLWRDCYKSTAGLTLEIGSGSYLFYILREGPFSTPGIQGIKPS